MYSIIVVSIPVRDVNNISLRDSRIVSEEIAKTYKETLPTKIGSTLTVYKFPNDWDMILTTITKIS